MTVANRAIGAPINIWNDHSDSMSMRDSGWVQLYADSNQSAVDLHVQAFRIAEQLSLPVMVCMDGFVLTHAVEALDVPEQEAVDAFLPAFHPRQVLDPAAPTTIGAMVGPDTFTEVKHLAHLAHLRALDVVPAVAADFAAAFGRDSGGLVSPYRCDDAETVVVALGSVVGTLQDVVDELRDAGRRIGVLGLTTFRPFPTAALSAALGSARRVVVLERAFEVGVGGIVARDVLAAVRDRDVEVRTVVAGLGGRPVTRSSLRALLETPVLPDLTFLDLDVGVVAAHLAEVGG
jgi:pyruvate ferredoxin oxidoreductase alpha subunit